MEKILLSMSRREQEDIDEMMEATGSDLENLYAALPNPRVDELLSRDYNKRKLSINKAALRSKNT
jgi:hypothetical protein